MLTCEDFERHYLDFSAGRPISVSPDEIRQHRASCRYCARLTTGTAQLHTLLTGLPALEPRAGFELRLQHRIATQSDVVRAPQRAFPRWAALGAGLATGLALAVFVILPKFTGDETAPAGPVVGPGSIAVEAADNIPDTSARDRDSTRDSISNYDAGRHSRLVSAPH